MTTTNVISGANVIPTTTTNVAYVSNEPRILETHQAAHYVTSSTQPIVERTYEKVATVIRHDEKALFESHTVPT
jgi:uncharacterized protein YqgV (UPF0045/DUF77 family)